MQIVSFVNYGMKGEVMVFNIKRVFVAMICSVFIFGFSMSSMVTAGDSGQDDAETFANWPRESRGRDKGNIEIDFDKTKYKIEMGPNWEHLEVLPPELIPTIHSPKLIEVYLVKLQAAAGEDSDSEDSDSGDPAPPRCWWCGVIPDGMGGGDYICVPDRCRP